MKVPEDFLITTISGNKIHPSLIECITSSELGFTIKLEYTDNRAGYVGFVSGIREQNFSYESGTEEFDQVIFQIYLVQVLA